MDGVRHHEVLAEADVAVLRRLADAVAAASDVEVLQPPTGGLVHMQVRDPVQGGPFYLGEVLVTECRVAVGGVNGFGCVLGDDPERALCAAVIDAALEAGHPLAAEIGAALEEEAARQARRKAVEHSLVQRTRVNFEIMEG